MRHHAAPKFWECYRRLPAEAQRTADQAFQLFKADPRHPSLHFKKLDVIWSARVGLHHRALAIDVSDGTHAKYDRIIE